MKTPILTAKVIISATGTEAFEAEELKLYFEVKNGKKSREKREEQPYICHMR